jgi:D-alanine-D-alanine ligase
MAGNEQQSRRAGTVMEDHPMSDVSSGAPVRVAVLAGGDSAEREISLQSGAAVAAALVAAGHQATPVDPACRNLADLDWSAFDAAFVALHGGAGEDGRVQQLLEDLGVPYTGSGPAACRLAMSKSASKERFEESRVPTPAFELVDVDEPGRLVASRVARLGYPLIIKPDSQGSSLGVSIVDSAERLPEGIRTAGRYDRALVAESLVTGREFTAAVLGDRPFPLLEILTPERFFSFDAKYQSSLTEYRFDFMLPARNRAELLHAAVAAAQALGTRGLVRVDLMLGHDGRAWVLEVNTSPGMTSRSLAPQAAARAGLDMAALVDLLVRDCLAFAGVS